MTKQQGDVVSAGCVGDRLSDRVRGQAGIALIPALIAMAITAIAVIALFSALTTVLLSTGAHRRTVRAGNEATAAAEALKNLDYVPCEGSANMKARLLGGGAPVYTEPTGYELDVILVEYLDDASTTNPSFGSNCTVEDVDGQPRDEGIQRVTLRITSAGTPEVHEDVVVMIRNDTCPAAIGPVLGEKC